MDLSEKYNEIIDLISRGKITEAVKELFLLLSNSEYVSEIIILSSQLETINNEKRLGIISDEAARLSKNKIRLTKGF